MSTPDPWAQALPVLSSRLVQRARRLGVDAASAEDLAQDALYEACRLRERLYDPTGIDRWLDAIFSNVYRRWATRTGRDRAARSLTPSSELDVADDYDLEVELERGELVDLLDRALGLLPAETRNVLIGRFVQETPIGELAGQLGLQPGAARMRVQRGKLALRSVLTTTYAQDAVSWGLIGETETGWQETRIWCPTCGTARLRARFSGPRRGVEFVCPHDHRWCVNESDTTAFAVTGFRATLRTVGAGAYDFWLGRLRGYDHHPHPRTVTWDDSGGVQAPCLVCGDVIRTDPQFQALFTPDGRQFWKEHPRLRTLASQPIEVDGMPAVATSFQSVTSGARLDVVLARNSFRILRSQRS